MIATAGLLSLLVNIVIIGLIFWVVWWALGKIALPEPFNKVIQVIIVLIVLVLVVNLLLGLSGTHLFR